MKQEIIRINDKVNIENIYKTDLHMHTVYCDGKSTPEQMVLSAIEKGMECIGFSGHSYVEFDSECGMNEKNAALYFAQINDLKEKYKDRITIYCGVERDDCSKTLMNSYDYVIGSVHYVRISKKEFREKYQYTISDADRESGIMQDDEYYYASVDDIPEKFIYAAGVLFDNDYYSLVENYFEAVSGVLQRTGADIIGHFDLVSKFNEKYHLFDEGHPRYIAAWQRAADKLLQGNRVFEINTGGISRGWKSIPYPSPAIMDHIREKGGRFILSSDSHHADTIGFGFGETYGQTDII